MCVYAVTGRSGGRENCSQNVLYEKIRKEGRKGWREKGTKEGGKERRNEGRKTEREGKGP